MRTELTNTLKTIDLKAAYDHHSKILLSFKVILAHILKECVPEFKTCSIQEIESCIEGKPKISEIAVFPNEQNPERIEGNQQEDIILNEGIITYDIRFNALDPTSGNKIHLIINVEAQKNYYPGYPLVKRALYYCCRMISSQKGTEFSHSEYQDIKKVCSIWICINAPVNKQNTITSYEMTEINLAGHTKEDPKNYDLLSAVMVCLGNFPAATDNDLLKLLNTLYTDTKSSKEKLEILDREFNIPATEKIENEVKMMCNLSDYIEERGELRGERRGELRGEKKGFAKAIQQLMDNLKVSPEEAMKMLNVEDAEKSMYLQMINNE